MRAATLHAFLLPFILLLVRQISADLIKSYQLNAAGVTKAAGCLSRYQLAFALLLTELLPGLTAPLDTFDPAFDDVDRALLSNLGVTVRASHFSSSVCRYMQS